MTQLFDKQSIGLLTTGMQAFAPCKITLSNGKVQNWYMVDQAGGAQAARVQVDTTVNGDMYITGCLSGIGYYTMTFYDAVDGCNTGNADVTVLSQYLSAKSLSDRVATIEIFAPVTGRRATSKASGKFTGVIKEMGVVTDDSIGTPVTKVTLKLIGVWYK